jgi:hypothetical protein
LRKWVTFALRVFDLTENRELYQPKFHENYSLDYSFFCTFDSRSNARLLRERRRHAQETSATSPGTVLWGLRPSVAAATFSGQKLKSPFFEIARVLVCFDQARFIVNAYHSIM